MKKNILEYVLIIVGALLLGIGVYLVKCLTNPQGVMLALPYVCIGIGCGVFGNGMGNVISRRALKNNPEIQKQIEIDKSDERNIAIINRAKSKAYDMMVFVFGALMISFALMGVDMIAVLLLAFAYLLVISFAVYYRCKYEKEM
ncbi:DUF6442 family protein [Cytobacillus sp. Hz8]|uniref:DUF6442 family protein n=1 Tax=Cytobacillus sp. Hz8 TaxID=3347168 RepID=UPI0035DC2BCA